MSKPIFWLTEDPTVFPSLDHCLEEPDGLLAAGGDLSAERIIHAYKNGVFPWYSDPDPILWWSPNPRAVLSPNDVHISKSLKKLINKQHYQVTWDQAFEEVISLCSKSTPIRPDTWITEEMKQAYLNLHRLGYAHSVEVWNSEQVLVGGLYGLSLGKVFFGESMFSLESNTSKIAFIYLAKQLEKWGFPVIDCQVHNDHLTTLGAKNIPRDEFLTILKRGLKQPSPETWHFDWQ